MPGLTDLLLETTIFLFDLLGVILTKLSITCTLNSSKRFGDLLNNFLVGEAFDNLLGVLMFDFGGYFFPAQPFRTGLCFVGVIFALFFSGVTCTTFRTFLETWEVLQLSFRQETSISSSSIFMYCVGTISFDFFSFSDDVGSVSSLCFRFLKPDVLGESFEFVLFEYCVLLVAIELLASFLVIRVKNDEILWFSLSNYNLLHLCL